MMERLLTPTSTNQDEISKHLKKTKEDQKKYHDRHASKSMKERRQCTNVRMQPDTNSKPWRAEQEGILYAHASVWAVEVPQRHFL